MKRNILYLLILIVLGLLVYFFAFNKRDGSYKAADKDFAVKDTAAIGKIFIADMQGEKITLERKADRWTVNNVADARPEAMLTLLNTIAIIQVNIPVAKTMYDNVIKTMTSDNIKVELYDLKGKKIKCYYIGKPSTNFKGNFGLIEGSDVPFIINIPGFDGIISTRYSTDVYDWKSRAVFNEDLNTISMIDMDYPNLPDSSFTIYRKEDNTFGLSTPEEELTGYNPEITKFFASQFKNLNCENFIPDVYKTDSLKKATPVCIMTVKNTSGVSQSVKIFYRPVTYRTKMQFTYEGKEINFDLDKFYGLLHDDKDLAVVQNFVFGKLFVGPQYFYRTKPTNKNVLIDAMMEKANVPK